MSKPNPSERDLQDVENWYETEGSVERANRRIDIGQKDREPLEMIRGVLERAWDRKVPHNADSVWPRTLAVDRR